MNTDLVVSVVSFNAADALERCLSHLEKSDFVGTLEIWVADNASSDISVETARRFSGVNVLELTENRFYTGGNNAVYEATDSRYFLILNSDCYVGRDTLRIAVGYLDNEPEVGAVSVRMAFDSGDEQLVCSRFQNRSYALLWYTILGGLFRRSRHRAFSRLWYEGWDRTTTRTVDILPDSFMLVRRAAFPDGLYDEAMKLYFTEDDLCIRLASAGWRCDFLGTTRVVHPESVSVKREPPSRIRRIFFEDLSAYYRKHEGRAYRALLMSLIRASEVVRKLRRSR